MKIKKLSKKEQLALNEFTEDFDFWQQKLQIGHYAVTVRAKNLNGIWAQISVDEENKVASVNVSRKDLLKMPKTVAKHECCHLFLNHLVTLANTRFTDGSRIWEEWEKLTMILEKIL